MYLICLIKKRDTTSKPNVMVYCKNRNRSRDRDDTPPVLTDFNEVMGVAKRTREKGYRAVSKGSSRSTVADRITSNCLSGVTENPSCLYKSISISSINHQLIKRAITTITAFSR